MLCKKTLCSAISILLLAAIASTASADISLVGWWEFDGDATDSSGNGNDGTLGGDANFVDDDERELVLKVDGDGDYVDCENSFEAITVSTTKTIMGWAKADTSRAKPSRAGPGRAKPSRAEPSRA